MKFLVIILLGIALHGNTSDTYGFNQATESSIAVVDSNIFKYYPMNISNKWTWYIQRNYSPGPGYHTETITGTQIIRGHLYYRFKADTYIFYGNQYTTGYGHKRIDSITGNLYYITVNGGDTIDCISDSLNSQINDSTNTGCIGPGRWYRYNEGNYNIFSQSFPTKDFSWSSYFESAGGHRYAKNLGMVQRMYQGMMTSETYTLRGCYINGTIYGDTSIYLGIIQVSSEIPVNFSLSQNYPNPFNPVTKIKFSIPHVEVAYMRPVQLKVYDALGKEVAVLVNQQLQPGTYEADWDASAFPSGVYYYKLEVSPSTGSGRGFTESKKMVLVK
jgi:hypothetical protein